MLTSATQVNKQPNEKLNLGFQFSNWLSTGETLSGPAVSGSPDGLHIHNVAVNGTQVTFICESGSAGVNYRLNCEVDTSDSEHLQGDGILKVRDR